ncbi:MAG: heme-binding protein, partial [Gammaproteobacteria bacterium]
MKADIRQRIFVLTAAALLTACGGGSSSNNDTGVDPATQSCSGFCANANSFLTVADVEQILAQGINEAQARGLTATFAVTDRVGNVLAIFRMTGANRLIFIGDRNAPVNTGLDGLEANLDLPAAVSKAITASYLSSEGNAFTTRTASQIVQQNFNPGETNQPSGPLFGVQFSQLACSDFSQQGSTTAGPHRSPLGLAADPGGLPLYKGGVPVGGVGVIVDDEYSLDPNLTDGFDKPAKNLDEILALAATFDFVAPADRRADRITVEGKIF